MVGARARAIRECGQRRSAAHAHGYGICAMRVPPAGDCGHRPPDRNPIPRPPYPEGRYSQTPIARIWRCGCCSQEARACVECGALAFAMRPMRLCWFWGVRFTLKLPRMGCKGPVVKLAEHSGCEVISTQFHRVVPGCVTAARSGGQQGEDRAIATLHCAVIVHTRMASQHSIVATQRRA